MFTLILNCLFLLSFLTCSLKGEINITIDPACVAAFKKKIASGERPEWMLKRIRKDLEPFKGGIKKEQIDQIDKLSNLARYTMKNRILHCNGRITGDPIGSFIKMMHSIAPLPDFDFVVSLHDSAYHDLKLVSCEGPVFSFAKRISDDSIILIPDVPAMLGYHENYAEVQKGKTRYPWNKKENKAFWRGCTSGYLPGMIIMNTKNYMEYPRCKLIKLSLDKPDYLDARFNFLVHIDNDMTQLLNRNNFVGKTVPISEHLKYKYQILVDGFTCAFHRAWWQLFSDCVIFKQKSSDIQWYYDELKPNVHFVPVAHDFSDLTAKIDWARSHDEDLKKIVSNANQLAETHLKQADTLLYFYLLLNEYSKLMK